MPKEVVYKTKDKGRKIPPILEKPFNNFLREYGKFISKEMGFTGSGNATVYTVPSGKVFYLVSAQLFYRTGAIAPSSPSVEYRINNQTFLMLDPPDVVNQVLVAVSNPSLPIKLRQTETIKVYSDDANMFTRGTVGGFEVLERDLKFLE